MSDIEVLGVEEFVRLGAVLREVGQRDLRLALLREFRAVGKPVADAARASASAILPHRGGLAGLVAGGKFSIRTRLAGSAVSVRVVAGSSINVTQLDEGSVTHPVYGRRPSVRQSIVPGWFSKPTAASGPLATRAINKAAVDVKAKIEGSV